MNATLWWTHAAQATLLPADDLTHPLWGLGQVLALRSIWRFRCRCPVLSWTTAMAGPLPRPLDSSTARAPSQRGRSHPQTLPGLQPRRQV